MIFLFAIVFLFFSKWKKHFGKAMAKEGIDTQLGNLKSHNFDHIVNKLFHNAGLKLKKISKTLNQGKERKRDGYTHWQAEHLRQ